MAIIDPVGIDLPTGQYKRVQAGDTLRPEIGNLSISGGVDSTVLTGDLNLLSSVVTGDGGESGSISITTGAATLGTTTGSFSGDLLFSTGAVTAGTNNDQGDSTGSITIQTGTTGAGNGTAGSISILGGGTVEDSSSAGDIIITAGTAGGISTGGDLSLNAGGGYTSGNLSLTTSSPGPGGGGDITVSSAADITSSGNSIYSNANEGFVVNAETGIDLISNASVLVECAGSGDTITLQCNPGTPTTTVVLDDTYLTVNAILLANSGIGDATSNINIETQSGSLGGNGTSLYITPNLGIILEIGNTIKMDPDGTNNWIYGDDGAAATNPGEPLTLRGGHGNTSGNGAPLRLRGGDGGNTTGDGGNIELTPGATTGGTAGTLAMGTATADLLRFYGTTTGTAQQTVTGSRGGNAALADLLTRLANLGLIVDGTSA